jgi:predicted house-cleaning noncanonical NTP pyrophosphatase (MazG superfamily)
VVNPPPKIVYNSNEKVEVEKDNDEEYLEEIMDYLYDELKIILVRQNTNEEDIDD